MREITLVFVLALALQSSARVAVALVQQGTPAREPSPKEGQQTLAQGGYDIKVNVDSVFLNVSVRERTTNRSIAGLRKDDFLNIPAIAIDQIPLLVASMAAGR